ncbi:large ribosomal subunit protein mL39-like [Saccoglossus kowalevskii]|uniref:39S ribosomal protein L39, mitochondrial-like n=1 Tax=Saccoglossus kowalevskii TaxID=10224 RepID=A0ABM0GWM6_SACKO|nr:PREDICTED: 39S ribosomal protein L39, mitochondrial-like [Saccoglossus kowalevskii]
MCSRRVFRDFSKLFTVRGYCSKTTLSNSEVRALRNEIFENEKQRQMALVTRVEKIQVKNVDDINPCKLIMNKGLSTPYNIAMHFNKFYRDRSALALVNGELWDMLRPLTDDCEVTLLHFKSDDPREVNKAYWRSCSHMLGNIIDSAFKNDYFIELVKVPDIPVTAGCFAYDADLKMDSWKPTTKELMCLGQEGFRLYEQSLPFERLEVDTSIALQIFKHNQYKKQQIEECGRSSIVLYRCGDFVDISDGPMVTNTGFARNYSVTAVHDIISKTSSRGCLQRFQGVALPRDFYKIHHTTWEPIEERASKPVYIDSEGPWEADKENLKDEASG